MSLSGKESTCQAGVVGSVPGLERSPQEGIGNLLKYSCMGNPMDREAWRATVHGVPESNIGDTGDVGLIPSLGKIPWRTKWQPAPIFLPGQSHGQRSLAGYSPWGHRSLT